MQLPNRVTIALGTLIAGGVSLTQSISLSNPIHKLILLLAGVVLFILDPKASSPEDAIEGFTPTRAPQSSQTARPPA